MKFSTSADFTRFPRAVAVARRAEAAPAAAAHAELAYAELAHDERHLRRRALTLADGERILVDLPEPASLAHGDRLLLEDRREVEIRAAPEAVMTVAARDPLHLVELAWHIGNRHLAAEIHADRIVVLRDHVIQAMLEGLGAAVTHAEAPFQPMRGAYGGRAHGHREHDHAGQDHARHGHHHHD